MFGGVESNLSSISSDSDTFVELPYLEIKEKNCIWTGEENGTMHLAYKGQVKLAVYVNHGLLTIHVVQARHLRSKWKERCNAYVRLSLVPDKDQRTRCKTDIVPETNKPLFDQKFSFELLEDDHSKRLLISVWHKDENHAKSELLGCTSFGVKHLLSTAQSIAGWFHLLTESVGRKKHLRADVSKTSQKNIPKVNSEVMWMDPIKLTIRRGDKGFGFSVTGTCPCQVGKVEEDSPAAEAGLRKDDYITCINGQNVSRSTAESVVRIVRHSKSMMNVELQRPSKIEKLDQSPRKLTLPKPKRENKSDQSSKKSSSSDGVTREESTDTTKQITNRLQCGGSASSAASKHSSSKSQTDSLKRIHGLVECEKEYIQFMQFGIQRYSRPLRHCIVSPHEHATMFQNVEKLVAISEYHQQQLEKVASDGKKRDPDTLASVYQSKVKLLCEAYGDYCTGLFAATHLLTVLQQYPEFKSFLQDPPCEKSEPGIREFLERPKNHIKHLYDCFQKMRTTSQSDLGEDFEHVINGLENCYSKISKMSYRASWDPLVHMNPGLPSQPSTRSLVSTQSGMSTASSLDQEVLGIQNKLVFDTDVQIFQLCMSGRHLVYSGELLRDCGKKWTQLNCLLFSDILVLCRDEPDGFYMVQENPLYLSRVTKLETDCEHPSELRLTYSTENGYNDRMVLRAPTLEQKYTWTNVLKQRIKAVKNFSSDNSVDKATMPKISAPQNSQENLNRPKNQNVHFNLPNRIENGDDIENSQDSKPVKIMPSWKMIHELMGNERVVDQMFVGYGSELLANQIPNMVVVNKLNDDLANQRTGKTDTVGKMSDQRIIYGQENVGKQHNLHIVEPVKTEQLYSRALRNVTNQQNVRPSQNTTSINRRFEPHGQSTPEKCENKERSNENERVNDSCRNNLVSRHTMYV